MFKRTVMLVIFLMIWQAANAQNAYFASRVALYAGVAADVASTVSANGHEANPAIGQSAVRQVVIPAVSTVLVDLLTKKLKTSGHERAATITNFVAGSVHFGAAGWNVLLVRKAK